MESQWKNGKRFENVRVKSADLVTTPVWITTTLPARFVVLYVVNVTLLLVSWVTLLTEFGEH